MREIGEQLKGKNKPWSEKSMKRFYKLLHSLPYIKYPVYFPAPPSDLSPAGA